jgi:ribonuclease HII
MSDKKVRLTITVDPDLAVAAQQAIEAGDAESVSAWVSSALQDKVERDRRLRALAEAVASYETEFGEITEAEIATQRRADREVATVVRGRRAPRVASA